MSNADTGYIYRQNANDMTIDNFSGYATFLYDHTGDGTQATDYAAGKTTINSAAAGSMLSVVTDHTGIGSDDASVKTALNTLAGKIFYGGAITGENKLRGRVALADGLTASSAYLNVAEMDFDTDYLREFALNSVNDGVFNQISTGKMVQSLRKQREK